MPSRAQQPEPRPAKARSRRPIARVLPATLLERLRTEVREAGEASARLTRELDERYGIERDHGVSRRRLRRFLTKLAARQDGEDMTDEGVNACAVFGDTGSKADDRGGEKAAGDVTPADRDSPESFHRRLRNHRVRQASVASILDKTFGKLAECAPDLWAHRAYLMLVGVVYERLAINEEDVSTEELVALAKVVAENRRLEVRLREMDKPEADNGRASPRKGALPDHFGDIVRRVYGTNFHADSQAGAYDGEQAIRA
jgi:hypothetical protein